MTQPTDPTQPAWRLPPPPPPPPRGRGVIIALAAAGAVLAVLVLGASVVALSSGQRATVTATTPAGAAPTTQAPETEVTEPPQTTAEPAPKVVAAKVGETLTVTDELDANVVEVTVTRVRFSRGGEFDKPDHGRYLLATVKVKALANDVTTPTLYVLVGTEKYDQAIALLDAGAYYETYKSLSTGQTHQGLAVFDVPAGHGRIVLAGDDTAPIGYWTY